LQRYCHTQSTDEIAEILLAIRGRYQELGVPDPEMIIVDNCCHVRQRITKVFPNTHIGLDIYHFMKRYLSAVAGGTKNSCYAAVAHDITLSVLKERAAESKTNIAVYRSKEEQAELLESAYQKWNRKGVWNTTGASVHAEQMKHVAKGCLTRTRQDVRSDGSRIEGSHKGWNSLQRSFASGLEVMTALGHDFVLRRNVRVGMSCNTNTPEASTLPLDFLISTDGSHHIQLRNHIATTYNDLIKRQQSRRGTSSISIPFQPQLCSAEMPEKFGLVYSNHASTFGGLFSFKKEDEEMELLEQIEMSEMEMEMGDSLLLLGKYKVAITKSEAKTVNIDSTETPKPSSSSTLTLISEKVTHVSVSFEFIHVSIESQIW
ncbi:hypothetical protein DFH05DRAFT_1392608, partial [Lentinula detonsa]